MYHNYDEKLVYFTPRGVKLWYPTLKDIEIVSGFYAAITSLMSTGWVLAAQF